MLGDLARTNDTRPEVFLAHKDALLTHMREFHSELSRYAPLLADAVAEVDATGADRLAAAGRRGRRAALPRPAPSGSPTGGTRWGGLVQWFGAGQPQRGRTAAGRHDHRRSPTSRRCCAGSPSPAAAGSAGRASCATWRSGSPPARPTPTRTRCSRRCSASARRGTSPPCTTTRSLIRSRLSWWEAEPVAAVPDAGAQRPGRGRCTGPAGSSATTRSGSGCAPSSSRRPRSGARRPRTLASDGVYDRVLDEPETQALLGLLDVALAARVPVSRTVTGMRARWRPGRRTGSGSPCARRSAPRPCTPSAAGCTSTASGWR